MSLCRSYLCLNETPKYRQYCEKHSYKSTGKKATHKQVVDNPIKIPWLGMEHAIKQEALSLERNK